MRGTHHEVIATLRSRALLDSVDELPLVIKVSNSTENVMGETLTSTWNLARGYEALNGLSS